MALYASNRIIDVQIIFFLYTLMLLLIYEPNMFSKCQILVTSKNSIELYSKIMFYRWIRVWNNLSKICTFAQLSYEVRPPCAAAVRSKLIVELIYILFIEVQHEPNTMGCWSPDKLSKIFTVSSDSPGALSGRSDATALLWDRATDWRRRGW